MADKPDAYIPSQTTSGYNAEREHEMAGTGTKRSFWPGFSRDRSLREARRPTCFRDVAKGRRNHIPSAFAT